ncbi:MAG: glycosyltransferase, partial [Clostridiales bacterium]|nr:glycosyltransferase [Clostridiales bacterium]
MSNYEFISVIIVMRNEENYIEKCLLSILNQDYPKDKYEVIVVDGESTDKSVDIVSKYVDEFNVKIINNPKRNLASGWNLGIKNAKGNIVIRPDAHST